MTNVTTPRPEPLTDRRSIRRPTDRAPRLPLGYPPKDSKDVLKGCRGSALYALESAARGGPVLWSIKLQFRLHYPPPAQDPCYSPPSLALPAEQLLLESEQLCPLVSRQRLELLGCERHDLP